MSRKCLYIVLLALQAGTACASDLIRLPCDEGIETFRTHYVSHGPDSISGALMRTENPALMYKVLFESSTLTVNDYDRLVIAKKDLPDVMAGLAYAGSTKPLNALLSRGASPDTVSKDGAPILLIAAQCRRIEVARLLLDSGANVQAHDGHDVDAMAIAILEDMEELAKLLVCHHYAAKEGTAAGDKTIKLAHRLQGGRYIEFTTKTDGGN